MGLLVREAVTELKHQLQRWKTQKAGWSPINIDCAISVAETLLAALEKEPGTIHSVPACLECGGWMDSHAVLCLLNKPAERPSKLAGRTVDGWGWKAFRFGRKGLFSEMYGKGQRKPLPENQWLDYQDWHEGESPLDYPFHILKDERVAKKWVYRPRFGGAPRLTIRQVAWHGLRDPKPTYVDGDFTGGIFTAEEIYILPEEGMPISPAETPELVKASRCSSCGGWIHPSAVICRKCRVAEIEGKPAARLPNLVGQERPPEKGEHPTTSRPIYPPPPAERVPGKGDWAVGTEELRRCCEKDWRYWSKPHEIKTLSFDDVTNWAQRRMKPKEAVANFGPGFACRLKYLRIVRRVADPLQEGDEVTFGSKEGEVTIVSEMAQTCRVKFDKTDVGWFNTKDLTLVSPVYDRPAEKGDC